MQVRMVWWDLILDFKFGYVKELQEEFSLYSFIFLIGAILMYFHLNIPRVSSINP